MKRKRYSSFISQSGIIDRDSIEGILDSAMMVRVVPMDNGGRRGVRMIAELALHKLTIADRAHIVPVLDLCLDYVPDHRDAMHFYTHATALPFTVEALEDQKIRRDAIGMLRRSVSQDIMDASRELRREQTNGNAKNPERKKEQSTFFSFGLGRILNSIVGRAPQPSAAGVGPR